MKCWTKKTQVENLTCRLDIQEEHNKRVTFDKTGGLGQKIDKLMVMMGKLVMKDNRQNRQFQLQVYQTNSDRGQIRCNYEQWGFQDRFRSDNSRSNTFRGRPMYGQEYWGRSRYDSNYRRNYRNNMGGNQGYWRQNYKGDGFRRKSRNQKLWER